MLVCSPSPASRTAVRPPPRSVQSARAWADTIKQRSTLVGLVQPAGILVGLAANPMASVTAAESIAGSVVHGNLGAAVGQLKQQVIRATHPTGVGGIIFRSGLSLGAATDSTVGVLEMCGGLHAKDKYLAMMGGADLLTGASEAAMAAGIGIPAVALSVAAASAKTALVLARPHQYSRIQKVKTLCDAAQAVSTSMILAGVGVVPAMAVDALVGPAEMLYMNSRRFRAGVDHLIDGAVNRLTRSPGPSRSPQPHVPAPSPAQPPNPARSPGPACR